MYARNAVLTLALATTLFIPFGARAQTTLLPDPAILANATASSGYLPA